PFYREMKESDCKTDIDKWIFNLSNMESMETQLAFTQEIPLFARLEKMAEYSALDKKQQRLYDESFHNYMCYHGQLDYKYKKGHDEGIAEGRMEGIAEERAKAHKASLQSALTIYKTGLMPLEQIAKALNLDIEELKEYVNTH
ncbi:MAG: hypothetical protein IIT56_04500, partial [Bacteroidales bacterium]|nr:hypothetical protein [Bacteroidales bacterium]